MADLVTSLSSFIFPDVFQPLDGSDVELDEETVLTSSDQKSALDIEYNPSAAFQESFALLSSSLEISQEVTIGMEEKEDVPITPTKAPLRLLALSPITPTANLKVLMSAASPDIRVLDTKRQKKALFNAIADHASFLKEQQVNVRGNRSLDDGTDTGSLSQGEDGIEEDGDKPINRKSKSLGLLCQRFLSRYPDYPEHGIAMAISLDAISKDLGVERRRIYDIVNVLESIEMVSRVAKNKYLWHGKMNLDPTLARLKCLGEKKRYSDQIAHLKKLQIQNEYGDELDHSSKVPFRDISNLGNHTQDNDDKKDFHRFDDKDDINSRRDKSLGVMSQKFIMLFLVSQAKVITLDIAARVLIGDINYEIREGSKFKTKVRRLYDIANILTSLEMIQKVHVQEGRGRKPAFRWVGPNPDTSRVNPNDLCIENKAPSRQSFFSTPAAPLPTNPPQSQEPEVPTVSQPKGNKKVAWSRHASFNAICAVVERERRSYSSAPNSPVKESHDDQNGIAPTDNKFREDFEALRSKYPDQMSKIYVSNSDDVKQEPTDQSEPCTYFSTSPGAVSEGRPSSQCPSIAGPVSSPLCTPEGVQSFTPKVMSPMPGSCPMSDTQHGLVSFPVSFGVIKSSSPVGTTVPSPGRASVPSSLDAQSVLGGSTATSPSQFSLLTSTSKAIHWSVDQPDTGRRSKRTFKQATNAEFEYQPIVKRSKVAVEGTSALQRCCQDLASQIKPGQTRIIKIPVNGTILPQPTGKAVQAIFIRKDVSVLNNSQNSPVRFLESGHNLEMKSAVSLPQTLRTTVGSFSEGHYSHESKQDKTPDIVYVRHKADPVVAESTTAQNGRTLSLEVSLPTDNLAKIDSITPSAGVQQPFHEEQGKRHGTPQPLRNGNTKQQLNKTGLRLDRSKDLQRKSGIQRRVQETKTRKKRKPSPQQQGLQPRRWILPKACTKSRVSRALHLCPEFKAGKADPSSGQEFSQTCTASRSSGHPVMKDYNSNRTRVQEYSQDSKLGSSQGEKAQPICDSATKSVRNREHFEEDDILAWPLGKLTKEQSWTDRTRSRKATFFTEKTSPTFVLEPVNEVDKPTDKRALMTPSQNSSPSTMSLPDSPFLPVDVANMSPISFCSRPGSFSSLGVAEVDRILGGSPQVNGSQHGILSPVMSHGFQPMSNGRQFHMQSPPGYPYTAFHSSNWQRQVLSPKQHSRATDYAPIAHRMPLHPCCVTPLSHHSIPISPVPHICPVSKPTQDPSYHHSTAGRTGFTSPTSLAINPNLQPSTSHHSAGIPQSLMSSQYKMSNVGHLSLFTERFFRPITSSGNWHMDLHRSPDAVLSRCSHSLPNSQSQTSRAFYSQTSKSTPVPHHVAYYCESTCSSGNPLLSQSPLMPNTQHRSSTPRHRQGHPCTNNFMLMESRVPTHIPSISGNGLVYVSSPSISHNSDAK